MGQRGRLVQKIEVLKKENSDQQRLVNELIVQQCGSAEALQRCEGLTMTTSVPLERECTVCMDACRTCVFVPCGHYACCKSCASDRKLCPTCPICKEPFTKLQDVFIC